MSVFSESKLWSAPWANPMSPFSCSLSLQAVPQTKGIVLHLHPLHPISTCILFPVLLWMDFWVIESHSEHLQKRLKMGKMPLSLLNYITSLMYIISLFYAEQL